MTIRDGRLWLESILGEPEEKAYDKKDEKEKSTEYKKEKKRLYTSHRQENRKRL